MRTYEETIEEIASARAVLARLEDAQARRELELRLRGEVEMAAFVFEKDRQSVADDAEACLILDDLDKGL